MQWVVMAAALNRLHTAELGRSAEVHRWKEREGEMLSETRKAAGRGSDWQRACELC